MALGIGNQVKSKQSFTNDVDFNLMKFFKPINNALVLFKLDFRAFVASLMMFPRYIRDRRNFDRLQSKDKWRISSYPILLDRDVESASLGEYFWQDLLVANEIIKLNPNRHVDVGSRVDGFIGHLSCVRKVEVFDIRLLTVQIKNVAFTQWDITDPNPKLKGIADCVSCLHTLEHIGLGRYGDKLDPEGWKKGMTSLVDLLAPLGYLWVSVPIGIQRIEFNAHRVFDPKTIIEYSEGLGVKLQHFFWITDAKVNESLNISKDIQRLATERYNLGIFFFKKG